MQDCIAEQKNIIFDGTFGGEVQYLIERINQLSSKNIPIYINLLAVNEYVSKIGIYYRYEFEKSLKGEGRKVDIIYHNQVYKKIPSNIALVIRSNSIKSLSIYIRDRFLIVIVVGV